MIKVFLIKILVCLFFIQQLANAQTIKFATVAPEGSTWMKVMRRLDREVRKKTKNKLKIKFFAGGIKGDERSVIKQMKFGVVDSAGFAGLGLGEISGEIRALDLPLLLRSDAEVDYLYKTMFNRFAQIFLTRGYVLLGFTEIGFVHFFSQKPIRTKSDLKHTKCWTWSGDQVAETALKRLGISPIPLSLSDVFTSLQTGVIDTFYSPPLAAIAMQWFTKVKYFQEYPLSHSTGGFLITTKAFNRIKSKEHQKILKAVSKKYMDKLVKLTRNENLEAIKALKMEKIQFVPKPSEAELEQYEIVGKRIREELAGKVYSKKILEEVTAALNEFRKTQ